MTSISPTAPHPHAALYAGDTSLCCVYIYIYASTGLGQEHARPHFGYFTVTYLDRGEFPGYGDVMLPG